MIRKILIQFTPVFLLVTNACQDYRPRRIMTIGDSNGASPHGWVKQLQNKLPDDSLYNYSVPGNTIGFDNLGNERLNTLKNIDRYLVDVSNKTAKIDHIVILLGTNDCKAVFGGRQNEVIENMRMLVNKVRAYPFPGQPAPDILIVSPPPYGPDSILAAKYHGGDQRVERLVPLYKQLAGELECRYVNIYHTLKPRFSEYSKDGVHLSPAGQEIIATLIVKAFE